jgi:hypothetical protein
MLQYGEKNTDVMNKKENGLARNRVSGMKLA